MFQMEDIGIIAANIEMFIPHIAREQERGHTTGTSAQRQHYAIHARYAPTVIHSAEEMPAIVARASRERSALPLRTPPRLHTTQSAPRRYYHSYASVPHAAVQKEDTQELQ